GAMVGIYFKTNHMPVRFLIYVAITALTRLLISDVSHHHRPDLGAVFVSGAILLLALAILVVRYASSRFPSVLSDAAPRRRHLSHQVDEEEEACPRAPIARIRCALSVRHSPARCAPASHDRRSCG